MPSQDSEQAAEFVATVRSEHVPMKTWFQTSASEAAQALRDKYGNYPALWKEVLNWDGWKETRKEYLKEQQLNEKQDKPQEQPQIPRKRKSRWGTVDNTNANGTDSAKRQSRWGNEGVGSQQPPTLAPVLPGLQALPAEKTSELEKLRGRLREINHFMENVEEMAAKVDNLPRDHRDRSPSPPPIYGADGKRQNTRAVRWRQKYTSERQDLLEKIMRLQGAAPNNLLVRKRVKKISIPIDKHPNYNFIGLIIGPRGKTQKELEMKTGCKIAIRGRGSVKEGARGRRDGKIMEGDNEPLHVVITGDDQHAVDAAGEMIEQMLIVIDDEKNVHKQQQLRELALLNGTLKDDEFCTICAEKGHREFECPKRFGMKKQPRQLVKCAICGDTSHPTRDCTQQQTGVAMKQNQQELDTEYLSFMAELDGKKATPAEMAPAASKPNSNGVPPPPLPSHLPPPPVGLPPPQAAASPPSAQGPPSNAPSSLPPPPPPAPPAHMTHQYGTAPPQQQTYGQQHAYGAHYASNHYAGSQQAYPPHHGHQQPPQVQQVQPGQEGAVWDPSAYYGHNQGAGGFNWWEQ